MTEAELVLFDDTAPAWERAFYAFLAEKERRQRIEADRGCLLPDAPALLRDAREGTGPGNQSGGVRLRPRPGPVRSGASGDHDRSTAGLYQFLLPLPDPDEDRVFEPL